MKKMLGIMSVVGLLLAGCSPQSAANGDGFFGKYLVQPFIDLIKVVADAFGENYGIAIILITLAVRFVLMPFMLKTFKNSQDMKFKMEAVKPEMTDIQNRLKAAKSQEDKQKIQAEMMTLYRNTNINPLNMGCLPLIIQMPILMGFYYAIRGSHEIATHSFLWFNLGQPDIAMAIVAGILYFIQYRVSMLGMTEQQQKQMKLIGLLSPVMILFISFSAPAALPLYWAVGGLFLIVQTLISKKLYQQPVPAK
ncbi:membrane protein insertase YidC [Halobacillus salinarum]|uniref:Membrane protein insertase YidC n=1 Tax=Halobacillus salinarum TaxID=2932257 RepID=A0ABY4EGP0_9BACI|nr:membrane protein insertase YidC [Halobacillus salinarum]UOQ43612.1 membrane protein insertase YidC [Halobacillus salinarum]